MPRLDDLEAKRQIRDRIAAVAGFGSPQMVYMQELILASDNLATVADTPCDCYDAHLADCRVHLAVRRYWRAKDA